MDGCRYEGGEGENTDMRVSACLFILPTVGYPTLPTHAGKQSSHSIDVSSWLGAVAATGPV